MTILLVYLTVWVETTAGSEARSLLLKGKGTRRCLRPTGISDSLKHRHVIPPNSDEVSIAGAEHRQIERRVCTTTTISTPGAGLCNGSSVQLVVGVLHFWQRAAYHHADSRLQLPVPATTCYSDSIRHTSCCRACFSLLCQAVFRQTSKYFRHNLWCHALFSDVM